MLLFDKSNAQSTQLKTEVKWSKYNLNMMNLYQEEDHQFLDMNRIANINSIASATPTFTPSLL